MSRRPTSADVRASRTSASWSSPAKATRWPRDETSTSFPKERATVPRVPIGRPSTARQERTVSSSDQVTIAAPSGVKRPPRSGPVCPRSFRSGVAGRGVPGAGRVVSADGEDPGAVRRDGHPVHGCLVAHQAALREHLGGGLTNRLLGERRCGRCPRPGGPGGRPALGRRRAATGPGSPAVRNAAPPGSPAVRNAAPPAGDFVAR